MTKPLDDWEMNEAFHLDSPPADRAAAIRLGIACDDFGTAVERSNDALAQLAGALSAFAELAKPLRSQLRWGK